MIAAFGAVPDRQLRDLRFHATPAATSPRPVRPATCWAASARLVADIGLQSLGLAAWIAALAMVVAGLHRAAARDPRGDPRRCCGSRRPWRRSACCCSPAALARSPAARGLADGAGSGRLLGRRRAERPGRPDPHDRPPRRPAAVAAMRAGPGRPRPPWSSPSASAAATSCSPATGWPGAAAPWPSRVAAGFARAPAPRRRRRRGQARAQRARRRAAARSKTRPSRPRTTTTTTSCRRRPSPSWPSTRPRPPPKPSGREARESQAAFDFVHPGGFHLPELAMLAKPKARASTIDEGALRQNARLLESVLAEFGVQRHDRPDPPRPRGHPL